VRDFLFWGLMFGAATFFVVSGVAFLHASRHMQQEISQKNRQIFSLSRQLMDADSVLQTEKQLLLLVDENYDADIIVNTLSAEDGVPGEIPDILEFSTWMQDVHAMSLHKSLVALLKYGNGFTQAIKSHAGKYLDIEGQVFSSRALLRMRQVKGEKIQAAELEEKIEIAGSRAKHYRELLNELSSPVWEYDDTGKIVWINSAYVAAIKANDHKQVIDAQLELLERRQRKDIARAVSSGEVFVKRMHTVISGDRRAFDVTAVPYGKYSMVMAVDVEAQKNAEDALGEYMEAFDRTLDRVATAVAIFSPKQKLTYFNKAYSDMWRLDRGWLESGPSDGEILDKLRAQDLLPVEPDYRRWRENLLAIYDSDGEADFSWFLPDGRTIHITAGKGPDGSLTYVYDNVTERIDLERRYEALIHVQGETIDYLGEGVAVFAISGKLEMFNPAFANIWGLEHSNLAEEPHVDALIDLCKPLFAGKAVWNRVIDTVNMVADGRQRVKGQLERPDNSIIDYAGVPLPDGRTMLTFSDVTDRERIRQALEERNRALELADGMKTRFLSHVSYELRTPLTSIIGFAEILDNHIYGPVNEKQHEYLSDIMGAGETLRDIIDNIIDLSSIDAGTFELKSEPVDAVAVIDELAEGATETLRSAEMQLLINSDIVESVIFTADRERVKQVLYNLLANAIGFSEKGQKISLSLNRTDQGVAFIVEDRGCGIPQERMAKIFDRFESYTEGSRHRGAGLGLPLAKNIVELHGGTIDLHSIEGEGTRVSVFFPYENKHTRTLYEAA
jgi:signal transduction histidine kinase